MSETGAVAIRSITKRYGSAVALHELDLEIAAPPLPDEGQQELVAPAVGGQMKLVEHGKIRLASARPEPVGLHPTRTKDGPNGSCKGPVRHRRPILKPFRKSR